jgi:hypothetical protein
VGPPCGAGPREILIDLDVEMDNGDYAPEDEANDIENPDEENT